MPATASPPSVVLALNRRVAPELTVTDIGVTVTAYEGWTEVVVLVELEVVDVTGVSEKQNSPATASAANWVHYNSFPISIFSAVRLLHSSGGAEAETSKSTVITGAEPASITLPAEE